MYLLVASTAHDLGAGFSLLVGGESAGHRSFGLCLLIMYGIMIAAAMKVLVSTSADSTSVVLNSATVLFIADLVRALSHNMVNLFMVHPEMDIFTSARAASRSIMVSGYLWLIFLISNYSSSSRQFPDSRTKLLV